MILRILFTIFLILWSVPAFPQWTLLPTMDQPRNDLLTSSDDACNIFIFGGVGPLHYLQTAEKYTPQTGWDEIASLPSPLASGDAAYLNGKIYLAGGYDGFQFSQDLLVYDIASDSYSTANPMPNTLYGHKLNVFAGHLYLTGGANEQDQSQSACWGYDPSIDSWSSIPDMALARSYHGAVVLDEKLLVFGGKDDSDPVPQMLASSELYDFYLEVWDAGPDLPVTFIYGSSGLAKSEALACHGLQNGEPSSDCYAYSTNSKGWASSYTAAISRYRVGSCACSENIFVLGGIEITPHGPQTSNKVESFDNSFIDDDDDDDDNDDNDDDNDDNNDDNNDDDNNDDNNDDNDASDAPSETSDDENEDNGCCG